MSMGQMNEIPADTQDSLFEEDSIIDILDQMAEPKQ